MTLPKVFFDEDYYERGRQLGISLYENYRWRPEISIPIARQLMKMYPGRTILDFGCAKGYTVLALRELFAVAYGCDTSRYALEQAPAVIRPYLYEHLKEVPDTDVVYAKDVFEHLTTSQLVGVLQTLRSKCRQAFFIVPFGDSGFYRIPEYHQDVSHLIAEDEQWWALQIRRAGWRIQTMAYKVEGFKNNWQQHSTGNGFYFLT